MVLSELHATISARTVVCRGLVADALYQDDLASQLKHMGKGKNDGITKLFNAMGSVGAAKFQIQAEKDREEAARLRDELARIENQGQSSPEARIPPLR